MYQSLQDFKNLLIERKLVQENQITFTPTLVSRGGVRKILSFFNPDRARNLP
ncbi:MAG: hypothetical protein K4571_14875 [Deltaproteobacteria bacterium]